MILKNSISSLLALGLVCLALTTKPVPLQASETSLSASTLLRGSHDESNRVLQKSSKKSGKMSKSKSGKMSKSKSSNSKKSSKSKSKSKMDGVIRECPSDLPSGDYTCQTGLECPYGEETCCDRTFPSQMCFCTKEGNFICFHTEVACFRPNCDDNGGDDGSGDNPDTCPVENPVNSGMDTCSEVGTVCEYGEVTCCGETFFSTSCTCVDDQMIYICAQTACPPEEFCDGGGDASPQVCPVENPAESNDVSCSIEGNVCTYGEITCCGETSPQTTCTCTLGIFLCSEIVACLAVECDGGGPVIMPPGSPP